MKMEHHMNKRFLLLWFIMAMQLCFMMLGAYSENNSKSLMGINPPVSITYERNSSQVVITNGIFALYLANPRGYVKGISYGGMQNLLATENEEGDRGYLDVVFGSFERVQGTTFSIVSQTMNEIEVSFVTTWNSRMAHSQVPLNIDQRYIVRRGDSGFYSYVIMERLEGFPAVTIDQIRIVYKLQEKQFNYMAISDTRQRRMPSPQDRAGGRPLAYKEAVLLTHPSEPEFRGEVDDKYQYSSENQYNNINGWITADSEKPVGFWIITPSNEFRNGGPIKQDLTSHVGPTCLSMFVSTHYGGKETEMVFQNGETYKKVFGPIFVYMNSASSKAHFTSLWSDAKQRLSNEVKSWPYNFVQSKAFVPANERGTVLGSFQVNDWGKVSPANNAYIGLASPGEAGSWQSESKGYQFWTRSDQHGFFVIKNIVPGRYNLFAWVPGYIGDYKYKYIVTIRPGGIIKLNSLVYYPPRNGPTLWAIGIPDRSAHEFYVPDAYANLTNKLYVNDFEDRFRQYGIWQRYTDLYPKNDLVYRVGVDNYRRDWFYAHVPRLTNNKLEATTWKIVFDLKSNVVRGNYTLQLAIASATYAEVQVSLNDMSAYPPHFTTHRIGDDNAIARHGIHGLQLFYSIPLPSSRMVRGINTIFLRQTRCESFFQGVMYDYIRLESPRD